MLCIECIYMCRGQDEEASPESEAIDFPPVSVKGMKKRGGASQPASYDDEREMRAMDRTIREQTRAQRKEASTRPSERESTPFLSLSLLFGPLCRQWEGAIPLSCSRIYN